MPLPERQYFSLCNLASRWGVKKDDIKYYVEHGELLACCWLDMREVMRYLPQKERCSITCEYVNYEGYVGLKPCDCRKIFRCGKYKIVNFIDLEQEGFEIALTPHSRDALIHLKEIVVSKAERSRFEKQHGLHVSKASQRPCRAQMIGKIDHRGLPPADAGKSDLYINTRNQECYYKGELIQFGPIQSNIIQQLAEAHSSATPWLDGKRLLHNAGSQGMRMRDLFKTQPLWQEVVQSNKRGKYRIFEHVAVKVA